MHLQRPVVAAVVALALGAAGFRALHPIKPGAAPATAAATFTDATRPAGERRRPNAVRLPAPTIVVYVAGEVARGGIYTLPASARGADALRAAGGAKSDADLVAVNLAARLADGDEVAVPARGETPRRTSRSRGSAGAARAAPAHHSRKRKRRRPPVATGTSDVSDASDVPADGREPAQAVDLNAADVDELQTLPGIGQALAERIVTVRDQTGPFGSPDDLLDVGGMTQAKLDAIAPFVTVR